MSGNLLHVLCSPPFSDARRLFLWGLLVPGILAAAPSVWANPLFESYETGFGAWRPQAFLAVSDPSWEWSVTQSSMRASDGAWSLEMTASGVHDDGTVWVERALELPAGDWQVRLDFDLWSPFDADIGTWEKVAFIDTFDPEEETHFTVLGLADFGGWRTYSFVRTFSLPEATFIWVAFGLNIVFETTHTYFLDAATIRWTQTQSIESPAWGAIKAIYR